MNSLKHAKILITGGSGFMGTNLIDYYIKEGIDFINLDWSPPLNSSHVAFWRECNIMDFKKLNEIAASYSPTILIHLAARTDTDIYDLKGDLNEYIQNTEGTQNVLRCISRLSSLQRVVITSSMFVVKAGYVPKNDYDFSPFTLYGVSKSLTEKYTHDASLYCTWTIIRPQTIWGPWSMRYKNALFKVMKMGLYFHPDKKDVRRSYGYVGNVVWQINQILVASHEKIHQKVLYVGDQPVNLLQWVQSISLRLTGKQVRIVPTTLIRGIAFIGDLFKRFNISFPITTTRYNSMVEDYLTPIEKTEQLLGTPPYSVDMGVDEFISWYEKENGDSSLSSIGEKSIAPQIVNEAF